MMFLLFSTEVCPFCGKTYKRLKSHLPHCKAAAASSRTPLAEQDDTVHQTPPSQLSTAQGEKAEQMLLKKSKKTSSAVFPSSQSLPSSASPPLSTKKKKQKLSEQIKTASLPPSADSSLITTLSQSPSLHASASKPKTKTTLRDLIEAAKPRQVSEGSQEVTRPASEDLPSSSTPFVEDPLSSRTTTHTETKPNPYKDTVKDNARASLLSTETKPKGAFKKKAPKMKKASQATTKDSSGSLAPTASDRSSQSCVRNDFLSDNEGETEDLSVNKIILKSGSGHQARITLQDVRATLGRANATGQSSRSSILSQIEATDATPALLTKGTGEDLGSSLVTTKTLSDQLPSTWVRHAELQSAQRKSSKSIQAPLIPQRLDGSPQPELPAPLRSAHLLPEASQADRHPQASSLHPFPDAPKALPARVETFRNDDRSQFRAGKSNTANNATQGQ